MRPRLLGLVLLALAAAGGATSRGDPPPPPQVARGARALGVEAQRAGELACRGARTSGGALVPIRSATTVVAGGVKIAFGEVSMAVVELVVHDKRPRRVEVLGLGGGTFVFLTPPCMKMSVPMPPGFGPPLALRIEPCPRVLPAAFK